MYRDDIRDLHLQKMEANKNILLEFIKIYLSLKVGFPDLEKEREDLVNLVKRYFEADKNESEVLNLIRKCYGSLDDHEGVDEVLEEFDDMFENLYNHCQITFLDYEDFLEEYGNFINLLMLRISRCFTKKSYNPEDSVRYRMKHRPIKFQVFDEDFKKKMLKKVSRLPIPTEEEF